MTELAEKMTSLLAEYERRDISKNEFCKVHNISPDKLRYWYRKLRRGSAMPGCPAGFTEIRKNVPSQSFSLELVYPNGVKLALVSADINLINSLVKLY